jgi:hypothetical protein
MKKWNIPLTYEPKIQPVINGTIRQTIRTGTKFSVGDLIRFYTWQGKPYRSKRTTITEYVPLTEVIPCEIYEPGMWIDPISCGKPSGKYWWTDLDWLAALDGIVPATGKELANVLSGKNRIPIGGIEAQIIRW